MSSITKQVQAFVAGSASEHAFPGLSVEERKLVKITAEKFGLSSRSFGMGSDRQIHIFKPASPTTSTFEPHVHSAKNTSVGRPVGASTLLTDHAQVDGSPRTSVDTDSTKDSDSEAQDPQVYIKNSFVHFEVDSKETADPRIVQSMPAGSFVECLEAERTTIVESRLRRPLCLSEDAESDTFQGSPMLFPSTPNADSQMSFAELGEEVPVVQWISTTTRSSESITILPPAHWTPAPLLLERESSVVAMPPAHNPSAEFPQGSATVPESVTVLPPAFWGSRPASDNGSASPAVLAMQTSPQGPFPQPVPHGLPSSGPAPVTVRQDGSSVAVPVMHGARQGQLQGLQQEPVPVPPMPSGPAQPYFMPGMQVVLQGLANQPDFNGLRGTVSAFDTSCGRYNIVIEIGPTAHRRIVKVKFQNLVLAQPHCATGPPSSKASLALNKMIWTKQ